MEGTLLGNALIRIRPDMTGFDRETERAVTGGGMKKAGAAAGALLGAALAASAFEAIQREAGTDKVAAALGMGEADAQRVAAVSADVYKGAWGESTEQVNTAIQSVMQQIGGMATASDEQLSAVTKSALDLSTAFGVDVGQASTAAGDLIRNGLAKDATEAFDIITAGFQGGVDKRGDFLDTLTEYSGQFAKLGIDGTTATGLLSQGLAGGARDADKVADALKELSIRAIDGSQGTKDAYATLGLNADEMAAKFAAGGDSASGALSTVLERLRGMQDPVARSAAAVGLFGTQAEDLGGALFALDPSTAVNALGEVEGAAARMGDTLNDNAATKIEAFKRGLMDMGLQLVERTGTFGAAAAAIAGMAPGFMSVIGPMAQVSTAVNGLSLAWIRNTAQAVANKAVWAAGQGAALLQFLATAAVEVGKSTFAWVANTAAQVVNKAGMVAGQAIMVAMRGAVIAWTAVQWALNAALSANPIGLVVMAIAGLIAAVVLLYNKNEGFRQLVQTVWAAIKNAIGGVVDWLSTWVPAAFEAVKNAIGTAMEFIRNVIEVVWKAISWYVTTYVTIVRTVVETVFNVIRTVITTVMNVISTVIQTVWQAISWYVTTYVTIVRTAVETVFNVLRAFIGNVMDGIRIVISTAWSVISGVWERGVGIVRSVTDTVMGAVTGAFSTGLETVKSLFRGAVDAIGGIWNAVTGVVRSPIAAMFRWINDWMIDPLNVVLGKFGDSVKLGKLPIPTFHSGGYTGDQMGNREGLALLRNDEFVMNPQATAKNRALLEALNAGRQGFGIGGPLDIIGDIVGPIENLLAKGAAFAVDSLGRPLLGKLRDQFGGRWAPDVVIGGMAHVLDQVGAWASARDAQAAAAAATTAAMATASGGYIGPASGILGRPLSVYAVTSEFGMRNGVLHAGIDLGASTGTPVMAAAAGKVMQAGWYDGYGIYSAIDHGGGLSTTYGHMSAIIAAAGQTLAAGQVLGLVGSTGDSTGPHLHFETRQGGNPVNPRQFVGFDSGGWLKPGWSAVYNGTGRPEPVLTDKQWKQMSGGQTGGRGHTINITNVYPQAEPTSVSTGRALRLMTTIGAM